MVTILTRAAGLSAGNIARALLTDACTYAQITITLPSAQCGLLAVADTWLQPTENIACLFGGGGTVARGVDEGRM